MLARSDHDSALNNTQKMLSTTPAKIRKVEENNLTLEVIFHMESEEKILVVCDLKTKEKQDEKIIDRAYEIKKEPVKSNEPESIPEPPSCLTKFCSGFKKFAIGTVAVITAIPAGIYGLMFTSGDAPNAIGSVWWSELSIGERIFSVTNALIALTINTIANVKYIPEAATFLKRNFQSCCKSTANFFSSKTALILALAAALAASALGYDSFTWLSETVSILVAASNFLAYGARRYASIASLIARIRDFFDQDVRFQKACIAQLKCLKATLPVLNHLVDIKEFNEKTVKNFLNCVYDEAVRIDQENTAQPSPLFSEMTKSDKVKDYLATAFDIGLGAACCYFFFPIYAQKGFEGVKIIWKYSSDPAILDHLSYASQFAISFLPGMASSLLGFAAGYDFRSILLASAKKCKPKTFTVLAASAIACTAQANIAKGVGDASNLFGIVSDSNYGKTVIFFNGFASGCFLFNGVAKLALKESASTSKVEVKDMVNWLEKNKLSKVSIDALRQHTFFSRKFPERKLEIITAITPHLVPQLSC